MPSVGERLRSARESQGRELSQVASEIRIQVHYLEAIEAGNLDELPGSFFARSFVRQYAAYLKIPPADIAADLERWLTTDLDEEPPSLVPRTMNIGLPPVSHVGGVRRPRRKVMGAVVALVGVIGACSAIYALWLQRADRIAILEVQRQVASPGEEPAMPAPRVEPAAEPDDSTRPIPSSPVSAGADGPLWFQMMATEETWVRVRSGEETLFVGIMQPRESRRFSGLTAASLRTGNAGGLQLVVNGKLVPRLGPRGQIRVVTLTPEGTEITAPPRSTPSSEEDELPVEYDP